MELEGTGRIMPRQLPLEPSPHTVPNRIPEFSPLFMELLGPDNFLVNSLALVGVLLLVNLSLLLYIHRRGREAIVRMQTELVHVNRVLAREKQELDRREEEIGRLSGLLNEQRQINRSLGDDFNTALTDAAKAKEGLDIQRQRLADMETRLREREDEAGRGVRHASELQEELEATQAEIEGLRMSMDQQIQQFELYSTSLLQMRQRLEEQLNNCQDALRRTQLELADARRQLAEGNRRASA